MASWHDVVALMGKHAGQPAGALYAMRWSQFKSLHAAVNRMWKRGAKR